MSDTEGLETPEGDTQAETTAGMVDVVPNDDATSNDDAKQQRHFDKKIKEAKDEAKKEVLAELAQKFGIEEPEEVPTSIDEKVTSLESELAEYRRVEARREWEDNNSTIMKSIDREKWLSVNKEQKYAGLSYEEKAVLAKRPDTPEAVATEKEVKAAERNPYQGSVPVSGLSTSKSSGLSGKNAEIAQAMGWTEENYKAAGVDL